MFVFGQMIELERGVGVRGTEYKETGTDPELDFGSAFMSSFNKPLNRLTMTPSEEEALPRKQYLFGEKERVSPLSRLLLGINLSTSNIEEGEYLLSKGFNEYELGSRSRIPSIRNEENEFIRENIPSIVKAAKNEEFKAAIEWDNSLSLQESISKEAYINNAVRPVLDTGIKSVKTKMSATKNSTAYLDYRKLPKDYRDYGLDQFIKQFPNTIFDPTNEQHLNWVTKAGKVYQSKLRQVFN